MVWTERWPINLLPGGDMTRWTLLVIAATVACADRGDQPPGDAPSTTIADTVPPADTAAMESSSTTASAPAGAAPDRPSGVKKTGTSGTGATEDRRPSPDAGPDRGPTGAEAMGGVRAPTTTAAPGAAAAPQNLRPDQVKRLQAALNDAGCNAGAVDGEMGSGTRRGIACGLKKYRLRSDDYRGLYQALNLKF
jgi:hypothetical protein